MDIARPSEEKDRGTLSLGLSFTWTVVLMGALLMMFNNVSNNTFGVFFKPIAEQFGWNRSAMSGAYGLRWLVSAVLGPALGYLCDRYGARRVLLPGFIILGASFFATAWVKSLWQLYISLGLLAGMGISAPYVCVMTNVARWNPSRPGLALGVASAGTGLSAVVFPPLATKLIQAFNWQVASMVLGTLVLVAAVPACLAFRKPRPSLPRTSSGQDGNRGISEAWRMLPRLLKNRQFLTIVAIFFLFYVVCSMVQSHLVNYATDAGVSALTAAAMVSVTGVASTIGRLVIGAISDRLGTKLDTAICLVLIILALALLTLRIPLLMWVAAVAFGVGFGGAAPLVPALMRERFRPDNLGMIVGIALMGGFIGSATGPWMGGFVFDVAKSYLVALLLSMGLIIVALLIATRLGPARRAA